MWFWFFIASCCVNIFLFLYIRWLLTTISVINEENSFINNQIIDFVSHIKSIHDLEMFYGDETLQSLIRHGKALSDSLSELDLIVNEESSIQEIETAIEEE